MMRSEARREGERGEAEIGNSLDFLTDGPKSCMESPQTSVPPPFYSTKVSDEPFCLITPLSKLLAFPKKNWKNNPRSG